LGCRHRAIVEYFGQTLPKQNCGACDVCVEEVELMTDSLVTAQKILSCVARLKERFGVGYVARVLAGSRDQRILKEGHDQLSTYGLLSQCNRGDVRVWIEQLVAQEFLCRSGDYDVLQLTPSGWQVLKGAATPQLSRPVAPSRRPAKTKEVSWEGVDRGLFEQLRAWRRERAANRGVAPFVVASDVTLRDLARRQPTKLQALLEVSGIGEKKLAEYGQELIEQIREYAGGT
jgi:ATP-dependent DNA helicase RecQ